MRRMFTVAAGGIRWEISFWSEIFSFSFHGWLWAIFPHFNFHEFEIFRLKLCNPGRKRTYKYIFNNLIPRAPNMKIKEIQAKQEKIKLGHVDVDLMTFYGTAKLMGNSSHARKHRNKHERWQKCLKLVFWQSDTRVNDRQIIQKKFPSQHEHKGWTFERSAFHNRNYPREVKFLTFSEKAWVMSFLCMRKEKWEKTNSVLFLFKSFSLTWVHSE